MKKRILIVLAVLVVVVGLSVLAGLPNATEAASWGYIEGFVFDDVNWNGEIDPGEGGIHDVGVRISAGGWSAFTTTDWDGTFGFPGLNTGRYVLEVILPDTHLATTPVIIYRDLTVGDKSLLVAGADFGLAALAGVADSGPLPFEGSVSKSIFWDTDTSGDPGGPLLMPRSEFLVEGPLIATHMGKGTYTSGGWIDHPGGSLDPESGIYCVSLVPGTTWVTFVAVNGDELHASLEGSFCHDLAVGRGWGTFRGPFTGGTGRFEGAEGTVVKEWEGYQIDAGSFIDSSWTGTIGY